MRNEDRYANAGRSIAQMIAGKNVTENDKKDIQSFRELHAEAKEIIEKEEK